MIDYVSMHTDKGGKPRWTGNPLALPSWAIAFTEPFCFTVVFFNVILNKPELEEGLQSRDFSKPTALMQLKANCPNPGAVSLVGVGSGKVRRHQQPVSAKDTVWEICLAISCCNQSITVALHLQSWLLYNYSRLLRPEPLTGQQRLLKWHGYGNTSNKDHDTPSAQNCNRWLPEVLHNME